MNCLLFGWTLRLYWSLAVDDPDALFFEWSHFSRLNTCAQEWNRTPFSQAYRHSWVGPPWSLRGCHFCPEGGPCVNGGTQPVSRLEDPIRFTIHWLINGSWGGNLQGWCGKWSLQGAVFEGEQGDTLWSIGSLWCLEKWLYSYKEAGHPWKVAGWWRKSSCLRNITCSDASSDSWSVKIVTFCNRNLVYHDLHGGPKIPCILLHQSLLCGTMLLCRRSVKMSVVRRCTFADAVNPCCFEINNTTIIYHWPSLITNEPATAGWLKALVDESVDLRQLLSASRIFSWLGFAGSILLKRLHQ